MRRKLLSVILCVAMVIGMISGLGGFAPTTAKAADVLSNATEGRTKEEIIEQYNASLPQIGTGSVYSAVPAAAAPYSAGALSTQTVDDTIRQVNYLRWLAGIGAVSVCDSRMTANQAGSVLMVKTDTLAHSIPQPSDMNNDFYKMASEGIGSGSVSIDNKMYLWSANCAAGQRMDLSIKGYTDDTNNVYSYNVGHRLSILDYKSVMTSFGSCDGGSYRVYSCLSMYRAYPATVNAAPADYYSWPSAGYFPSEAMDANALWSVTLGDDYTATSDMSVKFIVDGVEYDAEFNTTTHANYYNAFMVRVPSQIISKYARTGSFEEGTKIRLVVDGIKSKSGALKTIDHEVEYFNSSSVIAESMRVLESHDSSNQYWTFNSLTMNKGDEHTLWIKFTPSDVTNTALILESSVKGAVDFDYTRMYDGNVFISLKALKACNTVVTLKSASNPDLKFSFNLRITSTDPVPDLAVKSAALMLQNDMTVIFKAPAELDAAYHDYYIEVEHDKGNGETKTERIDGVLSEDGASYEFAYSGVNAKEIGDALNVTIYAYDESNRLVEGASRVNYSVKEYCMAMLSKSDAELNAIGVKAGAQSAFRTMLVDLLNYGAEAQMYFGYKTESLANSELTGEMAAYASSDDVLASLVNITDVTYNTIENPQVTWKSAGINLLSKTVIRLKFEYTGDVSDLTLEASINGKPAAAVTEFEETSAANVYYAYFDQVKAYEFGVPVDFTLKAGDNAVSNTLRYSVESYVVKAKDNASIGGITSAMMKYGKSAAAFRAK